MVSRLAAYQFRPPPLKSLRKALLLNIKVSILFNPSLPSESSSTFPSSGSYISLLPSAYIYRNADSNEHDPLFCPSYTVRHIYNISMVFIYLLPLAALLSQKSIWIYILQMLYNFPLYFTIKVFLCNL